MPYNRSSAGSVKTAFLFAAAILAGGTAVYLNQISQSFEHFVVPQAQAAEGIKIAAPAETIVEPKGLQTAIFAGGCFWGIEGVFEHVKGVQSAESGYAGGSKADADYNKVSGGNTAHAEVVRVRYNPAKVSYAQLLHIFFSVAHDPTQRDRQGPDVGKQYRSALFPVNDAQRRAATAYIAQLNKAAVWKKPIATRIEAFEFHPAESYHQDFIMKNPGNSYIRNWDLPKIAALKRLFPQLYR
jgi:peptide-methionine (S)-S-oxide reductase